MEAISKEHELYIVLMYFYHHNILLFLIVTVTSFILVWVIDTVYLYFRIYINFLGFLLTKCFDEIEVWCYWPVALRGFWLLYTPKHIIVGFLLDFIFVFMHPISNNHAVSLVPCIFLPWYSGTWGELRGTDNQCHDKQF